MSTVRSQVSEQNGENGQEGGERGIGDPKLGYLLIAYAFCSRNDIKLLRSHALNFLLLSLPLHLHVVILNVRI